MYVFNTLNYYFTYTLRVFNYFLINFYGCLIYILFKTIILYKHLQRLYVLETWGKVQTFTNE